MLKFKLTNPLAWAVLAVCAYGVQLGFAAEEVSVTDEPLHLHTYQVSLSNSVRAQQGSFDQYGAYHAYPDGSSAWALTSSLNGSYRLSPKWELDGGLSFRKSTSTFPTGQTHSFSYGSPLVNVKYHVGGWPHLVLHAGGSPGWTYKKNHSDGNPSASLYDDFGDGQFQGAAMHFGAGVSRSFHRFRFAFDTTTIFPFTTRVTPLDPPGAPSYSTRQGNRFSLSEGLGYTLTEHWGLNGGFRQMWGMNSTTEGAENPGTAGRLFTTRLGASYNPSPIWRWMAAFETSAPFYTYAVNQSYSPAMSVGLTYAGI